METRIMIH